MNLKKEKALYHFVQKCCPHTVYEAISCLYAQVVPSGKIKVIKSKPLLVQ